MVSSPAAQKIQLMASGDTWLLYMVTYSNCDLVTSTGIVKALSFRVTPGIGELMKEAVATAKSLVAEEPGPRKDAKREERAPARDGRAQGGHANAPHQVLL